MENCTISLSVAPGFRMNALRIKEENGEVNYFIGRGPGSEMIFPKIHPGVLLDVVIDSNAKIRLMYLGYEGEDYILSNDF
ncbi:hypothetical protein GIJ67_20080 [Citrobacter braakii]|uniref:hypothetical protein n=1 Tax=Citrobacter braakii TaxID=57706 RepID=UPI0012529BB0|nr:hypothetical protein [Citrobacter braakii]KAA0546788.1 hypothetical protein F0327_26225 [Citrobacter braakii]MRE81711.1 hypothetical protein [Citrobacter braakii]